MLDLVRLYLKAGDGGNGRVAFYRNRHILKGGPVGGDGGDGGNIIIKVDDKLNTLQHFSGQKKYIAKNGTLGGKARQVGKRGENIVLKVPRGTVVWLYNENEVSFLRRQKYGVGRKLTRDELPRVKFYLEKETGKPRLRPVDEIASDDRPDFRDYLHRRDETPEAEFAPIDGKLLKIATLNDDLQSFVICQGGFGGRGNDTFKSSRNTTPLEAEYGTAGEQKMVFLELQLLANVGLVGLPNAGKSTLLAAMTAARPKIANYPFTTLEPNLGVLNYKDGRELVLADIPGLIEGAGDGKGLGYDFLRHISNCLELVYILSATSEQIDEKNYTGEQIANFLESQLKILENEVNNYSEQLTKKRRLIVINKLDLYPEVWRDAFRKRFPEAVLVSAATGEGLAQLKRRLWDEFQVCRA